MRYMPDWWREWIDGKADISEPRRLKEGAPDEIKQKFEEYMRQRAEDRAKGIWR